MTIAYSCILIATVLPYLWVAIGKLSGERFDNRDPRGCAAKQTNSRVHRASQHTITPWKPSHRSPRLC